MIAKLNHPVLFSPVGYDKVITKQNPSFIFFKVRCFRTSTLTNHPKVIVTESALSSNFTPRFSRLAKNEAQHVLFDYLHCTRSFSFMDAEHISKNSPHFLQILLSKVDTDKQVAHSLTKFLRYNPINEFEPFFESLGLSPSELSMLLPRHLMFLSDDHVMLDNFHVLCNYGIPRSKMGKMYKEAKEIFGYDYGILALKLQAYEKLGLSKPTVIKLISCCPSLLIGGVNCEFVKVLERLKELRFENDWIGGYLSGKSTYNWNRMLDTVIFLDTVGYSEEQMRYLFNTNPALLFEGSGKNVYVLFGRLLKSGLKMNEIYSLFIQNPNILSVKCIKNLLRAVDFLLEIEMGTEYIASIISNHIQLLGSCTLKGPKTVCKELKVGRDGLCQIIKEDPLKLFNLASKSKIKSSEQASSQDPSKHQEKTTFLMRLGYMENSDEMMKALKQFRGRGDQLQERFDCLVQAGLDCNTVTNMVKQAPMVLNQTKDVIEKKIDCLRNYLAYPLESVVAFPAYLCYDMERISQRFSMYVWLRERGAAKPTLSLSTILACSDTRFVKYFVDVHPEGPALWEKIKNHSPSS
uniref:Transcription termination factor MTEF18, mitochondrial-like n=1 Tax=Fagus sylvatica TaxID=28930 RepID=A0A2N9ISM1_FAGSY